MALAQQHINKEHTTSIRHFETQNEKEIKHLVR